MKPGIIAILLPVLMACSTMQSAAEEQSVLTKQISEVLKEAGTLKAGMSRKDLTKIFVAEAGGISTPRSRTFVYRGCPYIKVDVEFTVPGKQGELEEHPSDKISKISKPYLAWAVID